MCTRRAALVAAVVLLLLAAGCGPSASKEDLQRQDAAIAALKVAMDRIDVMRGALPDPADAREVPLAAPLPAEGLETVDARQLDVIFRAAGEGAPEPLLGLSGDTFRSQGVGYLEPDPAPTFASNMNLENRVLALEATKHVVVFRTTEVDMGKIGAVTDKDTFSIERPAVWKGWVFVYAFEDPPRLVAAFPTEATSSERMTVTTQPGKRPSDGALLEDAVFELHRETIRRLTSGD